MKDNNNDFVSLSQTEYSFEKLRESGIGYAKLKLNQ